MEIPWNTWYTFHNVCRSGTMVFLWRGSLLLVLFRVPKEVRARREGWWWPHSSTHGWGQGCTIQRAATRSLCLFSGTTSPERAEHVGPTLSPHPSWSLSCGQEPVSQLSHYAKWAFCQSRNRQESTQGIEVFVPQASYLEKGPNWWPSRERTEGSENP